MATTTIPWSDGSGDNIYLTYSSASGDQTVIVSSDANTGSARTKVVTFSASGASPVSLTINQDSAVVYGYTILGSPTISSDNIMTSGGNNNGIATNAVFSPGNKTWSIRMKVLFPSSKTNNEDLLFTIEDNSTTAKYSLCFQRYSTNNIFNLFLATGSSSSWDIGRNKCQVTISASWYYVKIDFTGTSYVVGISSDGENWTTASYTSSSLIGGGNRLCFGKRRSGAYFRGSIDLKECMVYIDNKLWWKAIQ